MKKLFFTTALVSQFVQINLLFAAEQNVSDWDDFKSAIINSSVNSVIVDSPLNANSGLVFNVNRNLTLTGKETTQNISGNSNQMHLLSRYQTGVLTIDNLSFDKFTRYSQAGAFDSTKGGTNHYFQQ